MVKRLNKQLLKHTLIVVSSYTIISAIWIIFSDQIVAASFNPAYQSQIQSYKGILFVLVTALFLSLLIVRKNHSIKKLFDHSINKLRTFQNTFEQAAVGIAHLSPDDEWIRVNKKLCKMLGYNKQTLKSLTLADIVHPKDYEKGKEKDKKLLSGQVKSYVMKKRYITKNGNIFHAKITKSAVYNGKKVPEYLIAIVEDITEEYKATKKLEKSLHQKELLVKEIHHRVKNNLAIISALLELQQFEIADKKAKKVLRDSMMRVKSMALIHESFYQSELNSFVKFEKFLCNYKDHIETSFPLRKNEVTVNLNCPPIKLNINLAIPLGLLVNELVLNTYLFALENGKGNQIDISVDKKGRTVMTKVKLNSRGLPSKFDLENSSMLGTTVIKTLAKQLDGDLRFKSKEFLEISVSFENKEKSGSASSRASSELIY